METSFVDAVVDVATARERLRGLIRKFLDAATEEKKSSLGLIDLDRSVVHAICAMTGIGKTRIAAEVISEEIKAGKLVGPVGYAVPTHRLGQDIANLFREHGVTAAVWRGRKAFIAGRDGPKMCDDLPAVIEAEKAGATIEKACCKGKNPMGMPVECPFYRTCAYQQQKQQKPVVWVFAHQMLFRAQSAIGNISVLFIDESFAEAGQSKPKNGVTLDGLGTVSLRRPLVANDLEPYRTKLAKALRASEDDGVSQTALLDAGLTPDDCSAAIKLEWALKEKAEMWPGMPIARRAKAGGNVQPIRAIDRVWRAARDLLANYDSDAISGRIFLADEKTNHGTVRVVKTRGVLDVAGQYMVPTLIMDATLPSKLILQTWFPSVEIVGDISAAMPHVRVRQVLGAPITSKKLLETETDRNLRAIRQYVLKRWIECGRQKTLVICQKGVKDKLAEGMPPGIHLEHFNAIAGLDQYRDVRLLTTIGRTLPTPFNVEDAAGLLSGLRPARATLQASGLTWFDKVQRGIRLRNGKGLAVQCDQHPDPLAEAVRWQVCEAELIQAIGRGRGVNRTADTPLDIDILADVVLPVTVIQAEEWADPGKQWEMAGEGIWLDSPTDMAAAWPALWKDRTAARNWLERNGVSFAYSKDHSIRKRDTVRYQRAGPKQNWKTATYDPAVLPDLRGWLEGRLGRWLASTIPGSPSSGKTRLTSAQMGTG